MHIHVKYFPFKAKKPIVIVMQHQPRDSHHLEDRLVLTKVTRLDNNAFARGYGTQAGNDHFPGQDQENHPGRHTTIGDEHDQGRHDDQLVRQGVKKLAEDGNDVKFATALTELLS